LGRIYASSPNCRNKEQFNDVLKDNDRRLLQTTQTNGPYDAIQHAVKFSKGVFVKIIELLKRSQ
jgi:hypothetical protein